MPDIRWWQQVNEEANAKARWNMFLHGRVEPTIEDTRWEADMYCKLIARKREEQWAASKKLETEKQRKQRSEQREKEMKLEEEARAMAHLNKKVLEECGAETEFTADEIMLLNAYVQQELNPSTRMHRTLTKGYAAMEGPDFTRLRTKLLKLSDFLVAAVKAAQEQTIAGEAEPAGRQCKHSIDVAVECLKCDEEIAEMAANCGVMI